MRSATDSFSMEAAFCPFSFGFLTFFLTGGLQWGEKLGVA